MSMIRTAQPRGRSISSSFNRWISAPRVNRAEVIASRENFGLRGVDFQLGMNTGCDLDHVKIKGHYVGIQLNDEALDVTIRRGVDWIVVKNPPRSIWIHPEGQPFSLRHSANSRWAGIIIPRRVLDETCRQELELEQRCGVDDPLIGDLFLAIIHQMTSRELDVAANMALSEALVRALLHALGSGHGYALPSQGGISRTQLRRLDQWLEGNLGSSFSVDQMAALLGLSTAHFSREFKRSTSFTPWDYVTNLRLDRACKLLSDGIPISAAAGHCGFSDHSHLSRVLKARRGLSPSDVRRQARAQRA